MDDTQLTDLYSAECAKLQKSKTWTGLRSAWDRLEARLDGFVWPWDTRFNTVWWAEDVFYLCQEIAFGFCWMEAYASHYGNDASDPHKMDCQYHASYHADNCIIRVMSCRDKLALLAWSYYCCFNPENKKEVLNFENILDRLKNPFRFGLTMSGQKRFVGELGRLATESFNRIKAYRDMKIHRFEPRIVIDSATASDRISYLLPVTTEKERLAWEGTLKHLYPKKRMREFIQASCHIKGVPFNRRTLRDCSWEYKEMRTLLRKCIDALFEAAAGSIKTLLRRAPLNSRRK